MPPLTLTNVSPPEEVLAVGEQRPSTTELRVEILLLAGLALAIAALFTLAPDSRSVNPLEVALCVALIAVAHSARFDLKLAWTAPVQLALVPTLFLLPAWLVPMTMAAGIVLSRLPDVIRGQVPAGRLLVAPSNAWFTVGPAAVLAAAGSPGPAEAGVLVLVAMLAAQIGTDFVISSIWHSLTLRAPLKSHLRESYFVYGIDAALAPVGLLAALSLDESPYYVALMVPLFGVLAVFANERRARLAQLTELNGAYRGTAMVLAEVVDADDAYTGMHTRDVVELSVAVAERMGLEPERARNVEFGALLHDVGKVAIPNEIINKPGSLNDAEWELMRTHTIAGQRMLDHVGGAMREVGAIVRSSHERWDGGGYPDGLASEQIPLEARIVSACDAYNAMTTTRAYREAVAPAAAVAELVRCAGSQFDPAVVRALLAVIGVAPADARDGDLLAA